MRDAIRARMVGRVWFVGSSPATAPQIEASFRETLDILDAHLASRPYLFGRRPAFADFGLWGQIYNAWTDPTPGAWIEGRTPHVLDWVQRMLWPHVDGEFEAWDSLAPTLAPLLERQVGRLFLPWSAANAAALDAGREEFTVELAGSTWTQKPQKYHAKSLAALRARYAAADDKHLLDRGARAGRLPRAACGTSGGHADRGRHGNLERDRSRHLARAGAQRTPRVRGHAQPGQGGARCARPPRRRTCRSRSSSST